MRELRLNRALVIVLVLAFFSLWACVANAATFSASLDRDAISLGETATLSLTVNGGQSEPPSLPDIPNLSITYIGPSSQFTIVNGQASSSVTHRYSVSAKQAGDFTIPAVTVDVGGQKLSSQPLLLKVLQPSAPTAAAISSGSQLAFLKLEAPKKEVYVGETFMVELQLYLGSRVQRLSRFQLTSFGADGFVTGKMAEGQHRQAQVGNAVYTIIPVTIAVKAIKAGNMNLGPVAVQVGLVLPENRRRDPFDSFFSPFGGESKQVSLASEAVPLQCLEPPRDNAPADFTGAVGKYSLSMTAGPTNVAAGDPITVKVQITGRGSLDGLTLPEQTAWRDFKTYPPTTKVELSDGLGLQGTKTFEQIVVPQSPEIKALPGVSFSYFDPDAKAYRTLTQPELPLIVRPGGAAQAPSVLAASRGSQENQPPAQGIVPNKQRLGTIVASAAPLVRQSWFLALQSVPLLVFISALLWRRRNESLANNPRLRRQRQVALIVRDGLGDLRRLAAENKSDEFFATLFHLLQEQLGERLDVPATSITEAVIEERLRPKGVPEPIIEPLHELFQTCNLARYAPIKTSQELAAIIPRVELALKQLQEVNL